MALCFFLQGALLAFIGLSRCVQESITVSTSKAVYGFVKVYTICSFFFAGVYRFYKAYLGGSWVVTSGVISPLI